MNVKLFNRTSIWVALFFIVAIVLVFASRSTILLDNFETGDAAANTLLILDAKSFHLWVGNYSRIGFNHPGPAILYVLAAGEVLFYDLTNLVKVPFSGQLIAGVFYNAFWICLLGSLFFRMLSSKTSATLSFVVFLFTVSLLNHQFFTSIWFPFLYFFPFAVALLSLARLAEGKTDSMIFLALSCGFLINGHVCFVPVLGIMFLGIIIYNFIYNHDRPELRIFSFVFLEENKKKILLFAGIIFIFLIPLMITTIKEFPGPIPQYIHFGSRHAANNLIQSTNYISTYWGGVAAMLIGILACCSLFSQQDKNNHWLHGVAAAILSATAAALFYAKFGVDMLDMQYIEYFYYAAPALLAAALTSTLFQYSQFKIPKFIFILLTIATILGFFYQINEGPYKAPTSKENYVTDIYNQLKIRKNNQRIVLDLDNLRAWEKVWETIVGTEAYAKRTGDDLFCINKNWHILFTKYAQCSAAELRSGNRYTVTVKDNSKQTLSKEDFQAGGLLFIHYEPPVLNRLGYISIRDNPKIFNSYILDKGWSTTESDLVWSIGHNASLNLNIAQSAKAKLIHIDLGAFLPDQKHQQTIKILIEGNEVSSANFTWDNNRKTVVVPLQEKSGNLHLTILIEHPLSPNLFGPSQDTRELGVSLYGLQVIEK